jgi:G:T/U-mismatch repair DNA glycosylase
MQTETHPWNWHIPEEATAAVIGTFPPTRRNWSFDFFYPNKNNYFWKIIAQITARPLFYFSGKEAVSERKELLNRCKVGVSDMGQIIRRKTGSSLDQNLEIVAYMDIFKLLQENPSIRKLIFTSSSGKSSAIGWFKDYLSLHQIPFKIPRGKRPLRTTVIIKGKLLEIAVLYSTSPRAGAAVSFNELTELYAEEVASSSKKPVMAGLTRHPLIKEDPASSAG